MSERLVLCGGARRDGGDSTLRLALTGHSQNVMLRLEDISNRLVKNIPGALIDLVEIATYIYCADQAVSRGGEAQIGMGSGWRRTFRFVIPVRNPHHWMDTKVLEPLCAALSFLSEDEYAFEFEKAVKPAPVESYLELTGENGSVFKTDEVVLFSSGLDSLSGIVEELSGNEKRVALVSHRSSSKIFGYQKQLVAALEQQFPKRVMHVPVLATTQEPLRVQEYTQRSRSFLFTALACVVARMFGNSRIRVFENGVVSINLPISSQVVGSRASRTTHPLVLERFREFLTAAVGTPIEIDNPFIWKTKADVIRAIVNRGCGGLIRHTISCTRPRDITKLHTHCGCCSQCLDRRFAILAANAAEHDPVEMYKVELLAGVRNRPKDQTMAESHVRTALELREMSELGFFGRFGGETARVCVGFPSLRPDDVGRQVFDLHLRHGELVGGVLKAAVEGNSAELVSGTLPPSSVLMMTVAPGRAPVLSSTRERADSIQTWIEQTEAETGQGDDGGSLLDREPLSLALKRVVAANGIQEAPAKLKSGPGAKTRGIAEAINQLWPTGIPKGLSAKDRNRAVIDWLRANGYSRPMNPERAIQRVLKRQSSE